MSQERTAPGSYLQSFDAFAYLQQQAQQQASDAEHPDKDDTAEANAPTNHKEGHDGHA